MIILKARKSYHETFYLEQENVAMFVHEIHVIKYRTVTIKGGETNIVGMGNHNQHPSHEEN